MLPTTALPRSNNYFTLSKPPYHEVTSAPIYHKPPYRTVTIIFLYQNRSTTSNNLPTTALPRSNNYFTLSKPLYHEVITLHYQKPPYHAVTINVVYQNRPTAK